MGIFSEDSLTISDLVLVKQEVSSVHVDLDMEWWADKQADLYSEQGVEPWRASVWIHTHPSGMAEPSQTDEKTMGESFGAWDFAVMLILTKDGKFYARADLLHKFPNGLSGQLSVPCKIGIDWASRPTDSVRAGTIEEWDKEFKQLVTESAGNVSPLSDPFSDFSFLIDEDTLPEVEDYVEACEQFGIDPEKLDSYASLYGCEPYPDDWRQIQRAIRKLQSNQRTQPA